MREPPKASPCRRIMFGPSSKSDVQSSAAIRRRSPHGCQMRNRAALTRRTLLKTASASAAITAFGGIARPSLSYAPDRPQITHGVQSGDVSPIRAWSGRAPIVPSRMLVEVATTESFRDIRNAVFVDALPESDFTAKALLENLPPGQDIFYRISFQDLSSRGVRRTADRALPHAAERPAFDLVPMVGRYDGPGLGHRRRARRHAHLWRHASQSARLLHPLRRQHLCRLPDRGGKKTCPTAASGAASSPRKSRSRPRRWPNIAATTNTICSTTICARSMPRCRRWRYGTITK